MLPRVHANPYVFQNLMDSRNIPHSRVELKRDSQTGDKQSLQGWRSTTVYIHALVCLIKPLL